MLAWRIDEQQPTSLTLLFPRSTLDVRRLWLGELQQGQRVVEAAERADPRSEGD
jgi:hypothetical protein